MGRKLINPKMRKVSLTLSVPFHVWEYGKEKGSKHMVEVIQRGLWAYSNNVSEFTLLAIKKQYEDKISRLQEIIDGRVKS